MLMTASCKVSTKQLSLYDSSVDNVCAKISFIISQFVLISLYFGK